MRGMRARLALRASAARDMSAPSLMLACPRCGLANAPVAETCHCGRRLQSPEEAGARRAAWDALDPAHRAALEADFAQDGRRYGDYLESLRKHRFLHAVVGTLLIGLSSLAVGTAACLLGPLLGAGAALLLNRFRGGLLAGVALFTAIPVLQLVLTHGSRVIPTGDDAEAWALLHGLATTMFCGVIGGYLGMRLDWRHFERSFHDDEMR
jgi:hypothetical protein